MPDEVTREEQRVMHEPMARHRLSRSFIRHLDVMLPRLAIHEDTPRTYVRHVEFRRRYEASECGTQRFTAGPARQQTPRTMRLRTRHFTPARQRLLDEAF